MIGGEPDPQLILPEGAEGMARGPTRHGVPAHHRGGTALGVSGRLSPDANSSRSWTRRRAPLLALGSMPVVDTVSGASIPRQSGEILGEVPEEVARRGRVGRAEGGGKRTRFSLPQR